MESLLSAGCVWIWDIHPPMQWWNMVKSSFPHLESKIIEHHHFTGRLLYWHPSSSNSHSWYWWVMTWLHQKLHNLAAPPQMLATLHCGAFGRLPKEGPGWNSPPASRDVSTRRNMRKQSWLCLKMRIFLYISTKMACLIDEAVVQVVSASRPW